MRNFGIEEFSRRVEDGYTDWGDLVGDFEHDENFTDILKEVDNLLKKFSLEVIIYDTESSNVNFSIEKRE